MAMFIVDGGYFVGRFQKHWREGGGKNIKWWYNQYKAEEVSYDIYKENAKRILGYDITYLKMRMEEMDDIDKVYVCYDGIYGRRPRGMVYKNYKRQRSGINPKKHKGIDVRDRIKKCGHAPMRLSGTWEGMYDEWKEADDIIAERLQALSAAGEDVIVMSKDSDMIQFLSWDGKIRLHDFTKEITAETVKEKHGIWPQEYVDWKTLSGDTADNIPGLPHVGGATAKKLLKQYRCIENIPDERFITYQPRHIEKTMKSFIHIRKQSNLSLKEFVDEFGSMWRAIEKGNMPSPIPYEIGIKLFERFPNLEIEFVKRDLTVQIHEWKKIIKLPMVLNS